MAHDIETIQIPEKMLAALSTPNYGYGPPWSNLEIELMRRLYETAASNGQVKKLARIMEELTGQRREPKAIREKARHMGLANVRRNFRQEKDMP